MRTDGQRSHSAKLVFSPGRYRLAAPRLGLPALALLLLSSASCARHPGDTPSLDADLVFCVVETNRYRATAGAPPLLRSALLEAYAAEGALVDGTAHILHSHFSSPGNSGITLAENELPWWPLARFRNVQAVMREGIAQMWAEGPGGGHYENIMGRYTQLGCGVFIHNGEITIVQNFR